MPRSTPLDLSRRERQIMSALYRLGPATAADIKQLNVKAMLAKNACFIRNPH